MNENDLLIKKKSILNSLNKLINSNKNLFQSHKFNLVQSSASVINSIIVPNLQPNTSSNFIVIIYFSFQFYLSSIKTKQQQQMFGD